MKPPSKPPAALAVLVGSAGGKSPKKMAAEEPDDLSLAAEDLIKAIKAGDAGMVAETFRAMKDICSAEYEEEEE